MTPAHEQAPRILVVDDDPINRAVVGRGLRRLGVEVIFATNGAEAVALARRELLDAILMDGQMPVMDGLEATRRIRNLPDPFGSQPIIGVTADSRDGMRKQYLDAGMNACLAKPIDWVELHRALAELADIPRSDKKLSRAKGARHHLTT